MRTAGVDLSSQQKKTAACVIGWDEGKARVTRLELDVSDDAITTLIGEVDKLGIDTPFGWPTAFADAVAGHSRNGTWPATYRHADLRAYLYRRTDLHVWEAVKRPPLSVSTDRIGIPAMRCAAILAAVTPQVALDGSGKVVEVYPAAALHRWGLASKGYKGPKRMGERQALVAAFMARTAGWLDLPGPERALCEASDDAFDAVISACIARAAAIGAVDPIPESERDSVRREGWIALPTEDSLSALA